MAITLCNSGPLIALGKLNRLDLLSSVFAEVATPRAVYREVVEQGLIHGASEASSIRYFWQQHRWPIIDTPEHLLTTFSPSVILDPGETEVLALATTYNDSLVLIDDELARAEARRLRLRVRGTIGIIVEAYRGDALNFEQIEFLLEQIANRSDIWISAKLCRQVLASLKSG